MRGRNKVQSQAAGQDRQSADLLSAVVSGTTDAMFVKDRDGKYLFVNEAASRFVGKPVAEVLGRDDTALFDAESAKVVMARDRRVMTTGVTETEEEVLTIGGVLRTYLATKLPYRDRDGNVLGVIGISRDITKCWELEQQLRAERDRFQTTVDTAPVVICSFQQRVDGTWGFPSASRRIEEVFGISAERLAVDATPLFDIVHPEDAGHFWNAIEASARDLSTWQSEFRVQHSSRGEVWVQGQAVPVRQPDGSILWHGYIADITDRKREEATARQARELVHLVLDTVPQGVFWKDLQSRHLGCNMVVARALGFESPEQVIGLADTDLPGVTPEQAAGFMSVDREVIETGVPRLRISEQLTRADGTTVWLETNKLPLSDAAGQRIGVIGTWEDVTESRKSEQALRQSEERLQLALSAGKLGIWEWDIPSSGVYWSEESYAVMGITPDQFNGTLDDFRHLVHPDDREVLWQKVSASFAKNGPTFDHEFRIVRHDGNIRWVMNQAMVTRDTQGEPIRMTGVVADITERKQAEEARGRLAAIVESTVDVIISKTPDGVIQTWNPGAEQLFGYTAAEMIGKSIGVIIPSDRQAEEDKILTCILAGEGMDHLDTVRLTKDGRRIDVSITVSPIFDANGRILGASEVARDISDRKRAEERTRESERLLSIVTGAAQVGLVVVNERYEYLFANGAYAELLGLPLAEVRGRRVPELLPDGWDQIRPRLDRALAGETVAYELTMPPLPGGVSRRHFRVMYTPRRDQAGRQTVIVVVSDVTEQRRIEEQFRWAQKMEAIGRLAGGVAHDFNNLLTVINGYTDIMLGETPPDHPHRAALTDIRDAGERASALTSQLLAFSRKAIIAPRVVDLNEIITQAEKLLRRLIGEDIALTAVLAQTACRIEADPNQLDQVILNLAVNARDAMPTGGKLTIETRRTKLSASHLMESDAFCPGWYVELLVRDTGCGMTDDVKARLFEPFFTTKDLGKGTGLGLAVVHGIVKQAGGHLSLESEVGAGTTFRVLFPEAAGPASKDGSGSVAPARRGNESVLLVEDDDAVRDFSRLALESQGYRVLAVSCGMEAIRAINRQDAQIDILVTDVVMPGMSGRELVDAARSVAPGLRVLYVSGYTDDAVVRHGVRDATDAFLQKPFSPLALARKVRAVLDG